MKFRSRILCLLLVFVILLSVSAVAANEDTALSFKEDSTYSVSTNIETNNELLGICDSEESLAAPGDGTFAQLYEKITNAQDGDTVVLDRNYTNTDNFNDGKGIQIKNAITIDGNGHTIDANNIGRTFNVYSGSSKIIKVTIKNINFINNNFTGYDDGCAVRWSGNSDYGELTNCTFTNCHGTRNDGGGAIGWYGRNGIVKECEFINCSAGVRGGAIAWSGVYGAVVDCRFVNCSHVSYGGAIYWNQNAKKGVVNSSVFEYCSANTHGGAVNWYEPDGSVNNCTFIRCNSGDGGAIRWGKENGTVKDCKFVYCHASGVGGAVYWNSANGTVKGSTFENCTANNGGAVAWWYSGENGNVSGSTFVNCSATNNGGAISWNGANGVLGNCSFSYCCATASGSGSGGAIWYGIEGVLGNCSFEYCSATYGGAVYCYKEASLTDCSFEYCSAIKNGAAIYYVTSGSVDNSNFTKNIATWNGAIFITSGSLTVNRSVFTNNLAKVHGGAIASNTGTTCIVDNSSFINNEAASYGGAINFFIGNVYNSNFTNNSASRGGAVRFNTKGNLTDCNFDENTASLFGGGIYFNVTSANVVNCNLNDNEAISGAGIFFNSGSGNLDNCSFANNSASGNGGGITFNPGTSGSLDNCSFINNNASNFGGAGYFNCDTVSLYDCNFTENYAQHGGAVCIEKDGNLKGCSFSENSASNRGGGIYFTNSGNSAKASIVDCNIDNNSARYGGGIFLNSSDGRLDNCIFTNNFAQYHGGGILYSSRVGSLDNCSFINNNASQYGGAGYFDSATVSLYDCNFANNSASYAGAVCFINEGNLKGCTFTNNSAVNRGGGIYFNDTANAYVTSCNFTNNSARYGGGIFLYSDKGRLENCIFSNNSATTHGGGILFYSGVGSLVDCNFINNNASDYGGAGYFNLATVSLDNCNFTENSAQYGGAVRFEKEGNLKGCSFTNNSASNRGGGIYFAVSTTANVINSNFTDNTATIQGGAIFFNDGSLNVDKSRFINNSANNGGAIASHGYGNLTDCDFILNSAGNYGGAVFWSINSLSQDNGVLGNISDSRFISNSAIYGGAVHLVNIKAKIIQSYFENNSASHSGGLSVKTSNVTVANSNFTDNSAIHGGGAIGNAGENPDKVYVEIKDSNFNNNHANNYGGALSLEHVLADNSVFDNNSAVFGGAIYSISPVVRNSKFKNNKALESGNSIFAIDKATVENSDIKNNDIYENNLTESVIYNYRGSSPYKITYEGKTYDAFAVERIIIPNGRTNDVYMVDPSLKLVRNVLDSSDVSEYVENLLYKYFKGELSYNDVSAMINSAVYGNSAINVNDNAPRVEYIGNNMVTVYEYVSLITPSSNTNFVFIKPNNYTLNQVITKEALNETAFVGDIVKFRINVTNGNNFTLPDVFVKDVFNDTEFEYLSFESSDSWTYDLNSKVFTLKSLAPSNASSLTLSFKVKVNGTLTNIAVAGIGENETVKNNTKITVFNPQLAVEKLCLTPTVVLGQAAKFEIVVRNNGDADLHDVIITENPSEGLVFDSYDETSLWKHSVVNNKDVWTLVNPLAPGEVISFIVNFNTTELGHLANYVDAESKETNKSTTGAGVDVIKAEFKVEKIALTPKVVLGDKAVFEIVVHNTGEADLTNIVVEEMPDASLVFDHYVDSGLFRHSVVLGKHIWTLDKLAKGTYAEFTLYFNTTAVGNISNRISVKSDEVPEEIIVSNTTAVLLPSFSVEKISLTPSVVLGQSASFEILIRNTGKAVLTDVYFTEDSFDGLIYDSALGEGIWTHKFENGKHTWTFNDVLEPDEFIELILRFNTTDAGKFTNFITAGSSQTETLTANATVNVLKPEFKVEKIVLTPKVTLGEQASYEIVVHNTGEADLTNVVVEEMPDDSLVFDHYVDSGLFRHSVVSGKHIWTLDKLAKGTYAGFIIYYNTTAVGNVSNSISVKSDEMPEEITASNTTNVLLPSFSVEKICLVPDVLVGNQTLFEIVIRNTGKIELTNVYFTEDSFDGLIYDSAIGEAIWTHKFENGKHTWTLNDVLEPDEFIGLILRFNTTASGNYTNFVSAASNQTGILIANATVHVYESVIPDPPEQNSSDDYKMDVFKTVITQEAVLGGQITFQIVVHNTGNKNLNNVKVSEMLPEGLVYDHFVDYLDFWTYNGDLTWTSNMPIVSGEYVGFFVTFNTTKAGKFENHIAVSADKANSTDANASFEILNPDFTIEKVLVEDNIANGAQATFEIVIHNTGNAPLNNLTVKEYFFEGLVYDHFVDYLGLWTYNGDLSWTMNSKLVPGEYVGFFVTFNTTKDGVFTNIVSANSSECGERLSNATLNVHNETIDVRQICLTPLVIVGEQAIFEITVQNTGNIPITVLKLSEYDFEGLVYDHFMDYLGHWINDGITWILNTTLVPGEVTSLFVVFNTTKTGNFTNIVLANNDVSDNSEILSANSLEEGIFVSADVEVVKPEYIIEKVALNKTANVGDEVIFEIIVHNIGKVDISNITVRDIPSEGLSYLGFVDDENYWSKNADMSWDLTNVLVPGQYSGFFVVFNATKAGVLENAIESDNQTFKASVEVNEILKPEYIIEKVALNKTANVGDEVIFEIIVHNIGKVDISNITVRDIPSEGLSYLGFMDDDNYWSKNGDLSWSLTNVLVSGQYSSFFVVFNATKAGTLENTLESDNLTSKASVEVKDPVVPTNPSLIVEVEVTTDPITGQPVLKVTVINNGDVDLDNVFVKINLPEGLKYGDYYSYDSVWNFNDGAYDLDGILKVGESKSLYIEIIGEPGEYLITVDGGFNGTVADSASASVKILDNSTPGNVTPLGPEGKSGELKSSIAAGNNATGNPLIMVILALSALGLTRLKRKD